MRVPAPLYQIETTLAQHLPMRPAQIRGLALWIYGTLLAHSACQSAVLTALSLAGSAHALRQRLREWLYDGAHKAAPCRTQVEVERCFAPLLRWILTWWRGHELALAIDATTCRASITVLAVSVLYRGCAIPVAWAVLPGNRPGPWLPALLGLLDQLHPAVPARFTVLVLADRGLWSPRLWAHIRALGWHPLLRVQKRTGVRREGQPPCTARDLVRPGQVWIGRVRLGRRQLGVTLIVVWRPGQAEPCAVVTDLAPERVGANWYALRMWTELGFRALKGLGWQWQRSRRCDPRRVARHWLVLALSSLWTLAHGTRCEDAQRAGVAPARLRAPVALEACGGRRRTSVLRRGLQQLSRLLARGGPWRCLWLQPEPWPQPPPDLTIFVFVES
jgi:hypothetical protein